MKTIIFFSFILIISFSFAGTSKADNFQFLFENENGDIEYASNAQINVYDDYGFIYQDETNGKGIINIDLEPGIYTIVAYYNDLRIDKKIQITGDAGIRKIYFE